MEEPRNANEDAEVQLIEEEYRVWKKNSPYLYDFVMTHSLDWPSLTVQWLPDHSKAKNEKDLSVHKLLIGTQSDGTDPNYLMIADVLLPHPEAPIDARKYDDERGEVGGYGGTLSKIQVKIKINHDGEIHRARYMPQNPFIIATKSPLAPVLIFDYRKHSSTPTDTICRPQHRCLGHTDGGYGISWNPNQSGHLLSAGLDHTVCYWDINESSGLDIQAKHIFSEHTKAVEDVDWHKKQDTVFGSVSDDASFIVYDARTQAVIKKVPQAHKSDVNCLSFHPVDEFLVATGGSDTVVKIWDLRNLSTSLHDLAAHKAGVYQVHWSPHEDSVLATSSEDRRVYVWDTSRIGAEQSPEDAEDGPPELLFIHGGHTAKVFDFSWNSNDDWYVASVAEDNVLQIWQMAETIYDEESDDADEELADDDLEAPEDNKRKKQKI